MYTDLGLGSHTGGSVHMQRHSPEEATDPALLEAGNIDMSIERFGQVDCGDVVLVREAHQYRQVCEFFSELEL